MSKYNEIKFTDADIVNPDDFIPAGESNPHNVRPWLLHDHGFALAVVFADCLQDALDEAADSGKLNQFQITETEADDYDHDDERIAHLGNACEPYDIENVEYLVLPNPSASFCTLFDGEQDRQGIEADAYRRARLDVIGERKCQGWASYETWSVSLIIDNDECEYNGWRDNARECLERNDSVDNAVYELAAELKSQVEDWAADFSDRDDMRSCDPRALLCSQLLIGAICEVDWNEIARHWIDDVDRSGV